MSAPQPATPREARWIAAGAAAFGLWLMLVGFGALPVPGGPRNLHGPLWMVLAAGLAFFLAGLAVLFQVWGGASDRGEFPPEAPFWMRAMQHLIFVAIFACFALIGSWIAFGPGPRGFSGSVLFLSNVANEWIGRAAFGFGAVLCWLGTLAVAIVGTRRLLGRKGASGDRNP